MPPIPPNPARWAAIARQAPSVGNLTSIDNIYLHSRIDGTIPSDVPHESDFGHFIGDCIMLLNCESTDYDLQFGCRITVGDYVEYGESRQVPKFQIDLRGFHVADGPYYLMAIRLWKAIEDALGMSVLVEIQTRFLTHLIKPEDFPGDENNPDLDPMNLHLIHRIIRRHYSDNHEANIVDGIKGRENSTLELGKFHWAIEEVPLNDRGEVDESIVQTAAAEFEAIKNLSWEEIERDQIRLARALAPLRDLSKQYTTWFVTKRVDEAIQYFYIYDEAVWGPCVRAYLKTTVEMCCEISRIFNCQMRAYLYLVPGIPRGVAFDLECQPREGADVERNNYIIHMALQYFDMDDGYCEYLFLQYRYYDEPRAEIEDLPYIVAGGFDMNNFLRDQESGQISFGGFGDY